MKRETHLPVIANPSHAAGRAELVLPLALAAVAAGADGLIVEVHPAPRHAMSDAEQQLAFAQFARMMKRVDLLARALGRAVLMPVGAYSDVPAGHDTALQPA